MVVSDGRQAFGSASQYAISFTVPVEASRAFMRTKARRPWSSSALCARWVAVVATDAHTFSLSLDGSTWPAGPRVATQPGAAAQSRGCSGSLCAGSTAPRPTRGAPLPLRLGLQAVGQHLERSRGPRHSPCPRSPNHHLRPWQAQHSAPPCTLGSCAASSSSSSDGSLVGESGKSSGCITEPWAAAETSDYVRSHVRLPLSTLMSMPFLCCALVWKSWALRRWGWSGRGRRTG